MAIEKFDFGTGVRIVTETGYNAGKRDGGCRQEVLAEEMIQKGTFPGLESSNHSDGNRRGFSGLGTEPGFEEATRVF